MTTPFPTKSPVTYTVSSLTLPFDIPPFLPNPYINHRTLPVQIAGFWKYLERKLTCLLCLGFICITQFSVRYGFWIWYDLVIGFVCVGGWYGIFVV